MCIFVSNKAKRGGGYSLLPHIITHTLFHITPVPRTMYIVNSITYSIYIYGLRGFYTVDHQNTDEKSLDA